jgi:hypothetical protein
MGFSPAGAFVSKTWTAHRCSALLSVSEYRRRGSVTPPHRIFNWAARTFALSVFSASGSRLMPHLDHGGSPAESEMCRILSQRAGVRGHVAGAVRDAAREAQRPQTQPGLIVRYR